jgi:RND family efflux transporter MFP subunit
MTRTALTAAAAGMVCLAMGMLAGLRLAPRPSAAGAAASGRPAPSVKAPLPRPAESSLLGIVIASDEVRLRAPFGGVVDTLAVKAGDAVTRGMVLAHLESPETRAQLAAAEASLQEANAHAERAARTLMGAREKVRRVEALRKYVAQEERSTAQREQQEHAADLQAARAIVAERSAHLDRSRQLLAEATIRAPFDGVVAQRYVQPLDRLAPQAPVLMVAKQGPPRVRFAGSPGALADLRVADRVEVQVEGVDLTLGARVEAVSPEIDAGARLVFAEASFEATAAARLRPGLVARVSTSARPAPVAVETDERHPRLRP